MKVLQNQGVKTGDGVVMVFLSGVNGIMKRNPMEKRISGKITNPL